MSREKAREDAQEDALQSFPKLSKMFTLNKSKLERFSIFKLLALKFLTANPRTERQSGGWIYFLFGVSAGLQALALA